MRKYKNRRNEIKITDQILDNFSKEFIFFIDESIFPQKINEIDPKLQVSFSNF